MDGIKIEVTGNIAKVIEKPRRITSGTIGLPVEFTFDSQWDDLSKKAVFRTGHFSIVCDLGEEGNTVPWEALVFPNMWLSIGVYGVNEEGTISIPTIWVNVSVIQPGTVPDGASPADPTPPVWQRIEDEVTRIGTSVDNVASDQKKLANRVKVLEEHSGEPLIVTIDHEASASSHTAREIFEAYEAGREIRGSLLFIGDTEPHWLSLVCVDENYANFVYFYEDDSWQSYRVDNYNAVFGSSSWFYVRKSELGDINTALKNIRDYAQSLVGGGES